jgi:tetratricopeptide (TPR) repeat protein
MNKRLRITKSKNTSILLLAIISLLIALASYGIASFTIETYRFHIYVLLGNISEDSISQNRLVVVLNSIQIAYNRLISDGETVDLYFQEMKGDLSIPPPQKTLLNTIKPPPVTIYHAVNMVRSILGRDMISRKENNLQSLLAQAFTHELRKNFPQAAKKYNLVLSDFRNILTVDQVNRIKLHLALCHWKISEYEHAQTSLKQVMSTSQEDTMTYRTASLFSIYIDAVLDFAAEIDCSKSDLELGRIHYKLGNYVEAEDYLRLAGKQAPKNQEIFFLLGRIHEELGDKEEATRLYGTVLQHNTDTAYSDLIIARLGIMQNMEEDSTSPVAQEISTVLSRLPLSEEQRSILTRARDIASIYDEKTELSDVQSTLATEGLPASTSVIARAVQVTTSSNMNVFVSQITAPLSSSPGLMDPQTVASPTEPNTDTAPNEDTPTQEPTARQPVAPPTHANVTPEPPPIKPVMDSKPSSQPSPPRPPARSRTLVAPNISTINQYTQFSNRFQEIEQANIQEKQEYEAFWSEQIERLREEPTLPDIQVPSDEALIITKSGREFRGQIQAYDRANGILIRIDGVEMIIPHKEIREIQR